jgi:hypothetical protein
MRPAIQRFYAVAHHAKYDDGNLESCQNQSVIIKFSLANFPLRVDAAKLYNAF